jgi:3-oxoacyl-[acyl-carrier protein] reductase
MKPNPLTSRVALVTGASRGLGRAIAESLARAGAKTVLNYARSREDAEAAAGAIRSSGGEAVAEQADVCDAGAIRAMLDRIESRWGPVEVLVNNATGPQPMKPLEDYTWQDFQDQLDFFVKAPFLLMKETLPAMKRAGWGRVIHIGSEVVDVGCANYSAYVAAKAAMVGLTRSWANEFGPSGITVNLIAPGWIPVERHADVPASEMLGYSANVPLRRQGVPADVAEAVRFLAGDGANFITGQCLSVNGGNTF